ncbi:MAG: FtsQ-type POTRA domain-containing protein [Aquificae bacterium]|nr:FtsQ-type POTRA domain-containing protein [Aquificota bacterium]
MENRKVKAVVVGLWIVLCAMFGLFSPTIPYVKELFEVKKVNVKGTDKFTEEDIKKVFEKENWFFLDKEEIKERLKRFNFVKKVEVKRLFVGNVDLIIMERKPFAYLQYRKKVYLIDDEGVRLDPKYYSLNKDQKIPLLIYNYTGGAVDKNTLQKVNLIKESFEGEIDFKKFLINRSQIACITEDDKVVVFSTQDIEKSIIRAKTFLKRLGFQDFKVLNFSFESMVVTRR